MHWLKTAIRLMAATLVAAIVTFIVAVILLAARVVVAGRILFALAVGFAAVGFAVALAVWYRVRKWRDQQYLDTHAAGAQAPQAGRPGSAMDPAFFQPYCTVVPYQAGGGLVAGRKRDCSVIIVDGDLVIGGGGGVIDRAPIPQIKIDTPAFARKVGASTFVQMNGSRWAIDFGLIGKFDRSQRRGPSARLKYARQRTREFTGLLEQGGATTLRG